MNKTLIKDHRLTKTMNRVRSGRTQLFREKSSESKSFISINNCDLVLTHPNKEMFAELIDGKWYWVSGCSECNGEPRGGSYIECDKHDRCSICGIKREEIKDESVWGGSNGWTCNRCKEIEDLEERKKAFDKLNGKEPDTSCNDDIICPHCGSKFGNDDIHETQDLDCEVCGGEFYLEVEYSVSYSTTVKGERITK